MAKAKRAPKATPAAARSLLKDKAVRSLTAAKPNPAKTKAAADISDDELLEELGLNGEPDAPDAYSHEQARVIVGFEEIVRFVDEHGRAPQHSAERDIFERLYAVRLERLQTNATHCALVATLDKHGLLANVEAPAQPLSDEELLDALGMGENQASITHLHHVRSAAEKQTVAITVEDVASRTPCHDFATFAPLFERVRTDLDTGLRELRRATKIERISQGEFFIVFGQLAYVAALGEEERRTKEERSDRRLRVIYDNGTESDLLLRSFQRALYKDDAARLVADLGSGPLFAGAAASANTATDLESGTVYVLRSRSTHPTIEAHRDVIHKIGVTGGDVEFRIANATDEPTYLFAEVDVVATYKLFNINRSKLEALLHRFFADARFEIEIPDRFGRVVRPREWFLLPLPVIDEAVTRFQDRSLANFRYDQAQQTLQPIVRARP